MSTAIREEVMERVARLGSLKHVFLVGDDERRSWIPLIWFPEIGMRYLIIEKDDLAQGVCEYLRYVAQVRRFPSELEVSEAMNQEKWPGWDTCEDYQRTKRAFDELAKRKCNKGAEHCSPTNVTSETNGNE